MKYGSPHHYTSSDVIVDLDDTISSKSFITASIEANPTLSSFKNEPGFITEPDSSPIFQIPYPDCVTLSHSCSTKLTFQDSTKIRSSSAYTMLMKTIASVQISYVDQGC
jgi:hypothetical protein